MAHEHSYAVGGNEKALRWALLLITLYLVAEVVGGLMSGSLALLSDAAHMFTDTVASRSRWPPSGSASGRGPWVRACGNGRLVHHRKLSHTPTVERCNAKQSRALSKAT